MKPPFSILLIGLAFTLAACNSLQSLGQDVQSVGSAIERAAR
ncbi:entericidin A/B family lipoprotein [Delftia sp. PS-11]|nr:entericidin A/B family lipoprotein [Delftia sp. PS-11]KAJ8741772.1 entericidin A/B family lipoprotein [Delftia sp. PS-11]